MAARYLQLLTLAGSAFIALWERRLVSLGAQEYRRAVVIRGRVGQADLDRLLGVSELPVLMSSKLLALWLAEKAHREEHRRQVWL